VPYYIADVVETFIKGICIIIEGNTNSQ